MARRPAPDLLAVLARVFPQPGETKSAASCVRVGSSSRLIRFEAPFTLKAPTTVPR